MTWLVIALAAALLASAALWARQRTIARRERARQLRLRLERAIARATAGTAGTTPAGTDLRVEPGGDDRLRIVRAGRSGALELPYDRLQEADLDGVAEGALYLLDHDAVPHDQALVLRRQGTDVTPHLVRTAWLDAFPGAERVPATPLGESGLASVYRLASRSGLRYLSATCLEQTGVATADLHGAVEAMLRQRFDEAAVRRTAEDGEALLLEDEDGRSAAFLFLVPDLLEEGETLLAAIPAPGRLALVRGDAAAELETLLREGVGGAPPLAPRPLVVTRERISPGPPR